MKIIYFISNYIEIFLTDFIRRVESLNYELILSFILNNKLILFFMIFTCFGIMVDSRFRLLNKLLIFSGLVLFLFFCNIYEYNDLHLFFKDLFWYMLILNTCFIIHVLYLQWIYVFFWKRRKERICWYITKISYILSISFLLFSLNYFFIWKVCSSDYKNSQKVRDRWKYILIIVLILIGILRFFVFIFIGYSSLLIGTNEKLKFTPKDLVIFITFFLLTFIISVVILKISRIIFVWFIIFIFYSIDAFYYHYQKEIKKIKENNGLVDLYKIKFWKNLLYNFMNVENFYTVIYEKFELPSHKYLAANEAYSKNYYPLFNWHFTRTLFICRLSNKNNAGYNFWYFLQGPEYSWYDIALIQLKMLENPDEDTLKEEFDEIVKKFNLSPEEISQLKVDYRKHYIEISKSY